VRWRRGDEVSELRVRGEVEMGGGRAGGWQTELRGNRQTDKTGRQTVGADRPFGQGIGRVR
jgi:hypothetical protein